MMTMMSGCCPAEGAGFGAGAAAAWAAVATAARVAARAEGFRSVISGFQVLGGPGFGRPARRPRSGRVGGRPQRRYRRSVQFFSYAKLEKTARRGPGVCPQNPGSCANSFDFVESNPKFVLKPSGKPPPRPKFDKCGIRLHNSDTPLQNFRRGLRDSDKELRTLSYLCPCAGIPGPRGPAAESKSADASETLKPKPQTCMKTAKLLARCWPCSSACREWHKPIRPSSPCST